MALIFDTVRTENFHTHGSTNNARFMADDWGLKLQNNHGYIHFGPANTSHAHIYTDRGNFYFNKQIQLLGGTLINQNDIRANVFYDKNNTSYYLDPATTGDAFYTQGRIRQTNQQNSTWPYQFVTSSVGNDNHSGFWVGSNGYPDMRLRRENSTVRALISSWERSYTTFGFTDSTDMRAPIFYDSNDTAYYVNPNSSSNLQKVTIVGTANGNDPTLRITSTTSNAYNHAIEAFNPNLTSGEANIVLFGKEGNDRNSGYIGYEWVGAGSSNNFVTIGHWNYDHLFRVYPDQTTTGTSFRAPIFYDVNNTGYYLHGDGTSRLNIVNANAVGTSVAGIGKVMFPYGAEYNSGSTTGAIKITLPVSWTNTMMTMKIIIYDYSINESFEVHCGGYNHTGGNGYWVNTHAKIIANGDVDRNFNVRFGHDGSKCCITIGETTSPWAYPKVVVTEWVGGHSSETFSNWDNGWDISIVTTLPSQIDQVRSNNQVGRYQSIVYDANNTNYYTDPDSTSNLNAVNANTISISGNSNLGNGNGDVTRVNDILHVGASDSGNASIIFGEDSSNWYGAHLYWDSGYRFSWKTRNAGTDTDLFYYDTNDLSYIHWNRHHHVHNKDINYVNQLHFQDNVRFYDDGNDNYLNFKYGDANYGAIVFWNGGGTRKGFVYADNAGFGLLDSDGQWAVRSPQGGSGLELRSNNNVEFTVNDDHTLSHGSSRAPIFYDSDNTGYYLNPASTSNLNAVTANSFSGNGSGVTNVNADTVDGYHGSRFFRRQHKANATVGSGWMTVASCGSGRHSGEVIVTDADSGDHAYIRIHWMRSYADSNFTVVNTGGHGNRITGARVLYQTSDNTYGTKLLQVYVTANSNYEVNIYELGDIADFGVPSAVTPVIENSKSGYALHGNELLNLDTYGFATEEGIRAGSHVAVGGNLTTGGTISNGSVWINDGTNYNGYNENIRLFNPANGVSVIAFAASGTSGTPTSSILGYSDRLEQRWGANWQERVRNGYVEASGSYRAPIFYDSNDTNSYFDKNRLVLRGGDPTIIFRDTDHTSAMWHVNSHRMYLLRGNGDTTGWTQVSGQWPVYWDLGNNNAYFGGTVVATNAVTAPIFYDSDNTGYYINAASTSVVNAVKFHGDFYHDTSNRDNGMFGSYDSTKTDHIWSMGTAYRNASNGANFGNLYGLAYKHTNNGTGGTMGGGHQMVWCNNGTPRGSIGYDRVWHTGDMQAGGNMYANAFYDDDNTNYYVNPATTSNLVGVTITGTTNLQYTNLYHSGTYGTSMNIEFTGSSASGLYIKNNRGSTADGIMFAYSNAPQPPRGTISISSTGVSYNSVSDYRAKENVTPLTGAIDRVSLLKPSRFNFIGDGETVDGFLAHEVQEVVPQAVNGEKDAVDEDGNDLYQSMDNSKMVPLLTAALQEAIAKIEDLESRLQAIENQ